MRVLGILIILSLTGFQVLRAQEPAECPCCSEEHRAFDFWVGKWEVRQADGTRAGINRIDKIQDGCSLRENWISARPGYTGTSLNFFNNSSGQWEQLWVDNSGNILKLKGNRKGNQMILSSDPIRDANGRMGVNRITWTLLEDERVRQLWELIPEEGQAQVLFDGYYSRISE